MLNPLVNLAHDPQPGVGPVRLGHCSDGVIDYLPERDGHIIVADSTSTDLAIGRGLALCRALDRRGYHVWLFADEFDLHNHSVDLDFVREKQPSNNEWTFFRNLSWELDYNRRDGKGDKPPLFVYMPFIPKPSPGSLLDPHETFDRTIDNSTQGVIDRIQRVGTDRGIYLAATPDDVVQSLADIGINRYTVTGMYLADNRVCHTTPRTAPQWSRGVELLPADRIV